MQVRVSLSINQSTKKAPLSSRNGFLILLKYILSFLSRKTNCVNDLIELCVYIESLALFALAVYLMIQGYTVQEDGYLLTAGQTFQRRSLSQEAHRSEYKEDGWNGTGWVV